MNDYTLPVECRTPQQIMADVRYLEELFAQDLPIIAATKRANAQISRRIDAAQCAQQRYTRRETYLVAALIAVAVMAAGAVWWVCA